ncbi:hypothetical protein L1857_34320 [Amycolatopsis thermalba]|uniref:Uncharacterized protein n=1 Tax=Amycolatopsis thermalba TaxID=944492 RepID=A0ABY4P5B7_9PSEU|nr:MULTISPECIES: hypothetical protein [Amycolatopsis]UQS27514.1 hypothetical protein L1857_34320 [Amycolatopsis thermalba]
MKTGTAQGARWIVGTLLFVQGFGSAVTAALWQTTFGVAGLLRAAGLPGWSDYVVGTAGAVLLIWALTRSRTQQNAVR